MLTEEETKLLDQAALVVLPMVFNACLTHPSIFIATDISGNSYLFASQLIEERRKTLEMFKEKRDEASENAPKASND